MAGSATPGMRRLRYPSRTRDSVPAHAHRLTLARREQLACVAGLSALATGATAVVVGFGTFGGIAQPDTHAQGDYGSPNGGPVITDPEPGRGRRPVITPSGAPGMTETQAEPSDGRPGETPPGGGPGNPDTPIDGPRLPVPDPGNQDPGRPVPDPVPLPPDLPPDFPPGFPPGFPPAPAPAPMPPMPGLPEPPGVPELPGPGVPGVPAPQPPSFGLVLDLNLELGPIRVELPPMTCATPEKFTGRHRAEESASGSSAAGGKQGDSRSREAAYWSTYRSITHAAAVAGDRATLRTSTGEALPLPRHGRTDGIDSSGGSGVPSVDQQPGRHRAPDSGRHRTGDDPTASPSASTSPSASPSGPPSSDPAPSPSDSAPSGPPPTSDAPSNPAPSDSSSSTPSQPASDAPARSSAPAAGEPSAA